MFKFSILKCQSEEQRGALGKKNMIFIFKKQNTKLRKLQRTAKEKFFTVKL